VQIRFLELTPSDAPGFPFVAGQVISLPRLTSAAREWIKSGRAVVLPEPGDEAAVMGAAPETAVLSRPRGRGSR